MAEMTIRPFEGFGPVDFGMTAEQIEGALGVPDLQLDRPAGRGTQRFYDRQHGIRVDLDSSGRCECVERLSEPCVPVYDGVVLVGRLDSILDALAQRGYTARRNEGDDPDVGSFYFDDIGIVLWKEYAHRKKVDTIGAWQRGYWEKYRRKS